MCIYDKAGDAFYSRYFFCYFGNDANCYSMKGFRIWLNAHNKFLQPPNEAKEKLSIRKEGKIHRNQLFQNQKMKKYEIRQ